MKEKLLSIILITLIGFTFLESCSNSDSSNNNQNLTQTPQAKSQYDNINLGLYKGVIVGSSGTIVLDISNSSSSIFATIIIDGVVHNFITNQTLQPNQNTTLNFVEGSNSFIFTVASNGGNPVITNLLITGHPNASILVVKETSLILVKCFEGTYNGDDSGIFNAVIYGNIIKALVKSSDNSISTAAGTIENNQINANGNVTTGATFTGALNGNNFSGTWTNTFEGMSGNWNGTRTY